MNFCTGIFTPCSGQRHSHFYIVFPFSYCFSHYSLSFSFVFYSTCYLFTYFLQWFPDTCYISNIFPIYVHFRLLFSVQSGTLRFLFSCIRAPVHRVICSFTLSAMISRQTRYIGYFFLLYVDLKLLLPVVLSSSLSFYLHSSSLFIALFVHSLSAMVSRQYVLYNPLSDLIYAHQNLLLSALSFTPRYLLTFIRVLCSILALSNPIASFCSRRLLVSVFDFPSVCRKIYALFRSSGRCWVDNFTQYYCPIFAFIACPRISLLMHLAHTLVMIDVLAFSFF